MADNTEKIVVDVDGSGAEVGFGKVRSSADAADDSVNKLGKSTSKLEGGLSAIAAAAKRAADAMTSPAETADRAKKKLDDAGDSATKAASKFDALQQSLFGVRGKAAFIWDLAADGFRMALGFADSFIDRIAGVQRTISLLNNIPGSNVGEEFNYLIGVANKYGLSLKSIQDDYTKYTLSAQNSSLSNDMVKRTFEQVAMSVRTLHMNAQQAQFTFLALEQMLSKGQVSLQELRRQFSERIPGAMQALAREMGVTMPTLLEFITKVGAASDKLMPKLGDALQRMFQGGIANAAEALDAQRNRLETSISKFFLDVLNAGGAQGMTELLKTINGLMKVDTIAQVFANAMNSITNAITLFLRSLKPDDIEKFAEKALVFLEAFARLCLAAGQAVIFVAQHIPQVAAAIGALVGATALAPLGPWGAAIGLIGGGALGYMAGSKIDSGGFNQRDQKTAEYNTVMQQLRDMNSKKDSDTISLPFGLKFDKSGGRDAADIAELNKKRVALETDLKAMDVALSGTRESMSPEIPGLGPLTDMMTGTPAQIMQKLRDQYGVSGKHKKTPEERLAERQDNFMQEMLAKAVAVMAPEDDRFATSMAAAKRLGLSGDREVKDADGHIWTLDQIVKTLQNDYNEKKQAISDRKTDTINRQFTNMTDQTMSEVAKLGETYSLGNLSQVDDDAWAVKARKMGAELEKTLIEQAKKMKERAELNPLYMLSHPDIDGEIADLRKQGNAYIAEFVRIEEEKKTVAGGSKLFLHEWNEMASNMGQITHDFLKGVTDNIVDMLTTMVGTGHLSFMKLTEFVLSYITKMLIVQAITPFMNTITGSLTGALTSILGIGSSFNMYGAPENSALMSIFGNNMLARAGGGDVWPGEPFLVGERGPEVVTFDRPGYVHPNESLRNMGGGNVQVSVAVDARGNSSVSSSGDGSLLGRRLADAVRAVLVDERRPGGILA